MKDFFFFNVKCLFRLVPFIKRDFLLCTSLGDNCEESQLNYLFTKEMQSLV